MFIRTNHKATISMTLKQGELFSKSNAELKVISLKTGKILGFITSGFFERNCYIRTANGGESVFYVCPFIRY